VEDVELVREATRIYLRYATEFVEALGLCPWATQAREEGHTRVEVVLGDVPDAHAVLDAFSADTGVAVGLLVFPRLGHLSRPEFERRVAALREADQNRHGSPPMALAAFHPDARADLGTPARLVPFIRRSPDPTIQCVRIAALADVRRPFDAGTDYVDPSTVDLAEFLSRPVKKPLHERVAHANLQTIERVGVEEAERILAAIFADRDATYGHALGDRAPAAG